MQGVTNDLREELAKLWPVQPLEPTISDNKSMALVSAPQSASMLMSELIEKAHARRPQAAVGNGQVRDSRRQPQGARQVRVEGKLCWRDKQSKTIFAPSESRQVCDREHWS